MAQGRPRKYQVGTRYSSKTFYYPTNPEHLRVWYEFSDICRRENSVGWFTKANQSKTGLFLRRIVYQRVIKKSKERELKLMALKLLLQDIGESIQRYNVQYHTKEKMNIIEVAKSVGMNITDEEYEKIVAFLKAGKKEDYNEGDLPDFYTDKENNVP